MKIEGLSQEVKDKVKQLLDNAPADQKADAIMQSIEMIEEAAHADLIKQKEQVMMQITRNSSDSATCPRKRRNSMRDSRTLSSQLLQIRLISSQRRLLTAHWMM